MDYNETLGFLFEKLPMFSRQGEAAFKKDLINIRALCSALGNPQQNFRTIHVGGTNGKGSTSHMLAAILQASGYKCGLYTSPHLIDFRERIRLNGEPCPAGFVVHFVEKTKDLIEHIQPSFFEITVAMAFSYFSEQKVDVAVIEVGLGGRLDSTNIIKPELSIITNIGWDHMHMLGNTLPLIAYEKAGIIKEETPVIVGEHQREVESVFKETASLRKAPLYFASDDFYVDDWKYEHHRLKVSVMHNNEQTTYLLDLTGMYQLKNLVTVLEGIKILRTREFLIPPDAVKTALANTKRLTGLKGRWDVIAEHPLTIVDVAHNYNGIKEVLSQLELLNFHHLHLIIGMVKDKEIDSILALLPKTAHYYFTKADIPRALDEALLFEKGASHGLNGSPYSDVNIAYEHALQHAAKDDVILICGSIFLIAELKVYHKMLVS